MTQKTKMAKAREELGMLFVDEFDQRLNTLMTEAMQSQVITPQERLAAMLILLVAHASVAEEALLEINAPAVLRRTLVEAGRARALQCFENDCGSIDTGRTTLHALLRDLRSEWTDRDRRIVLDGRK